MMRSPCMNNVGKHLILKVRPSFSLQLPKDQMKEKALAAFQTIKYISSNEALASHWPIEFPILHVLKKVQIGSSPQNKSLPLSYLVIEHLKSKNFDRTVIQQFETMMDPSKGIILPKYLTVQKRMKKARSITDQYAFFPNRITTPLIFRALLKFQGQHLMYGEAGTAKTSGICSFCLLASMVTDYIVTYDDDGLDSEIKRIPKIFYLSYKSDKQEDEDNSDIEERYINYGNMLKLQCPQQIFPQQLQTYINNNNNHSMVYKVRSTIKKAFRNKNIEVKVVVDQINTLAAKFQQYNNAFEKANEQKKQQMKKLGELLEQQKQLWVQGNLSFADENSVLFNSSVNIEKHVLDRSIGNKIGLDLNHHEKLPRTSISYFNAFRQFPDQAHSELVHAIFFELIKTASSLNNHDAVTKIKQAQKNLKRDQVKIDEVASITHLQIRQYLQGNDQFLPLINKVQSPKIGEYILQLIQQLNNNFINVLRQQSKKFHTQSENKAKRLLLLVLVRDLIRKNPKAELTFKNIQLEARSNINFQEQHVDNCLFDFKKNRVQLKIQMKFQPSVFLKATDFANFEFQSAILKNFDLFKQHFKNNPAIVGYLLEAYIFGFLKSASVVRIEFKNSKVSSCQKTAGKKFYQFYHFLSYINGQYVMSLQERLKQGLQSKDKTEKTFFFQPITSSDEKESSNNPSVDLLILKKIETDKYEITTVDFTVTSDTGQINKKKLKTQNLIKKVFEKYYGNDSTKIKSPKIMKWSHVIAANLPKNIEEAKLDYPVFERFDAPISYPSNVKQPEFPQKAEFSIEIISIHNIELVQLDQNSEARVYCQLVSKVLELAHKLANPQ